MPHSELSLRGLRAAVRLGCEAEERARPQSVLFDVEFRFRETPPACRTDRLDETVCYAEVSELLRGLCDQGEYRLIEKLAVDAYDLIRARARGAAQADLKVTLIKEHPPVPGLTGGSRFAYGDWLSS